MELLKISNPRGMVRGDFILAVELFKSIVISAKNELTMENIMTSISDSLNNRVELNIIRAVKRTRILQFLTKIGHGMPLLTKHDPDTQLRSIAMQLKWL